MQPFQYDLQAQIPKHPITTHTQAHPKQLEATVTLRQKKNDKPTAAATVAHTRYLSSSPAATLHGKTQGFVLRLPPPKQSPCNIMQPFQCDLQAQIPKRPITTHTQAQPKQLEATVTLRQKKNDKPTAAANRRTHEVPFIAGCSHFTRKNTRFRAPASSPTHHFPSSPLPIVTTSHRHHLPSSPLPFLTTSLPHHFPSSPLPFVTTSLRHHFPSSPLPIVTTSFVTTSLRHHSPSSSLPFFTASLRHHFLSSPLPSSPLPFVTTPLHHHFLKVNFIASYSFVMYWYIMYCYIMYCYMIYHPSSRSISLLLIGLWCIGTLCIVTGSTTLHHSQLHQVKSHS